MVQFRSKSYINVSIQNLMWGMILYLHVAVQVGFFSIVGIPLFKAFSDMFKVPSQCWKVCCKTITAGKLQQQLLTSSNELLPSCIVLGWQCCVFKSLLSICASLGTVRGLYTGW